MASANIEQIAISDLKPWARNARTHSRKQVRQIADSIETFGFTNPVLIDDDKKGIFFSGLICRPSAKHIAGERHVVVVTDRLRRSPGSILSTGGHSATT